MNIYSRMRNNKIWVVTALFIFGSVTSAWAFHPKGKDKGEEREGQRVLKEEFRIPKEGGKYKLKRKQNNLKGKPRKKINVEKEIIEYVKNNPQEFEGLTLEDLKVSYTAEIPSNDYHPAMVYVHFVQMKEGLEVVGSNITFAVKLLEDRSVIVSVKSRIFPEITLPKAKKKAEKYLKQKAKQARKWQEDKALGSRTVVRYVDGQWRRVHETVFEKDWQFKYLLDATTGEFLGLEDRARYAFPGIQGEVTGRGVLFDPRSTGDNLDIMPLKYLKLEVSDGTQVHTDNEGRFRIEPALGPLELTAQLKGAWAEVYSANDALDLDDVLFNPLNLIEIQSAQPGAFLPLTLNPTGNDGFITSQINAYTHINYIHDWLKERLPVSFTGIDRPVMANVNYNLYEAMPGHIDYCNALYAGISPETGIPLLIFLSGTSNPEMIFPDGHDPHYDLCRNSAFDTIVYHEYGHFLADMAGEAELSIDVEIREIEEGLADLIAIYATGQPLVAEGWTEPPAISPMDPYGFTRTADNECQYSPDLTWVQSGGCFFRLVVSGFGWQMRNNLISSYGEEEGKRIAENLILSYMVANLSGDIPSFVMDILTIDDNDADLSNGTPHLDEILAAADYHGIPVADIFVPVIQVSRSPVSGPYPSGSSLLFYVRVTDPDNDITSVNVQEFDGLNLGPLPSWVKRHFNIERLPSLVFKTFSATLPVVPQDTTYTFRITAQDAVNHTSTQDVTFTVLKPAPPTPSPSPIGLYSSVYVTNPCGADMLEDAYITAHKKEHIPAGAPLQVMNSPQGYATTLQDGYRWWYVWIDDTRYFPYDFGGWMKETDLSTLAPTQPMICPSPTPSPVPSPSPS